MKKIVSTILTPLCALFVSCCDCDPIGTEITYAVEGLSPKVSVEFHDDYGEREYHSSVKLPWIKKFTIKYRSEEYYGGGTPKDYYPAYISATVSDGRGHVSVSIYVGGKLVRTDSTFAENGTATASYAVKL